MLLPWVRHRREALRAAPFPSEWEGYLRDNVVHWAWLEESERSRLRGDIQIFVAEKDWEGARGLAVDEEIRVTVAAQACLLLLGWDDPHYYPNVRTIIVYPADFVVKRPKRAGYIETASSEIHLGEAWSGDLPVILAWDDVRAGGEDPTDGHNVVLHEFAHKLDMLHSAADGVPSLAGSDVAYDTWADVMSAEFADLRRAASRGDSSLLDDYGATNEAEFFAVVTEAFFEKPHPLAQQRPRLYGVLRAFYRQDTAARWEQWQSTLPETTSNEGVEE